MKSFSLFSSKIEEKENITQQETKKDDETIDLEVMKYVITEFPNCASDIKESLKNLTSTIEASIDYVEDKSNEVVKQSRDYQLGGKYRDTSIKLYEICKAIDEYIKWMEVGLEKLEEKKEKVEEKSKVLLEESEEVNDLACDVDVNVIKKVIYEDFTTYEPIKMKLGEHEKAVDGWEDMIVKTADLITKKYKHVNNLRYSSSKEKMKVIKKKSKENDSRDIVIDMLTDNNIALSSLDVYLRKITK